MSLPFEPVEISVKELLTWNQCTRRAWSQRFRSSGGGSSKSSAKWVWGQTLPSLVKHYLDTLRSEKIDLGKADKDLGTGFWKDLTQIARLKVELFLPIKFGKDRRLSNIKEMVNALVNATYSAGLGITNGIHGSWGPIGVFDKQENHKFSWVDSTVTVEGSVDLVLTHMGDHYTVYLVQLCAFEQHSSKLFEASAFASKILHEDPKARIELWKVDLSMPQRWANAAKIYKTSSDCVGYFRGQAVSALNSLERFQYADNVLDVPCNPQAWCYRCPLFKTGDCPDSEVMDPKELEL